MSDEIRVWVKRIREAERLDRQYGLHIPGDSALAVVFTAMEEAAYAERKHDVTPILMAWMKSWPPPRPIWPRKYI